MSAQRLDGSYFQKHVKVLLVLGFALIHGVTYLFVIPPWQHPDEPTQFEFAWLISRFNKIPPAGTYDQGMRREVAASMLEHGFFKTLDFHPNLLSSSTPIWIGISQISDAPVYYLIAGLPLRLADFLDVSLQLHLARFVSLLMYLATIAISAALVSELTPPGHVLRWLAPLFLALSPAFTDLMTAVNDDVGATLAFSLFLWLGVRLLVKGVSVWRFLAFSTATILCLYVKNTISLANPLAFVLLMLVIRRPSGVGNWAPWVVLLSLGLVVGGLSLQRSEAASWYRVLDTPSLGPSVEENLPAFPVGQQALVIKYAPDLQFPHMLYQPLSVPSVRTLQGKIVTLGGWIWSNQPTEISLPALWIDQNLEDTERIPVDHDARFVSYQTTIPLDASQIQVVIAPSPSVPTGGPLNIYFDGLVLVEGVWPQDGGLTYANSAAGSGTWGGRQFTNLLRNPSFEKRWLTIDPRANRWLSRYVPINLNQTFSAIQDASTTGQLFKASLINLFQSFWARFGWNHIALPDGWYWGLVFFSSLGVIGSLTGLALRGFRMPEAHRVTAAWLGMAGILVWGGAFARLVFPYLGQSLFLPSARYAFPAVIPSMLLLATGWYFILKLTRNIKTGLVMVVTAALLLDLAALLTIIAFYSEI